VAADPFARGAIRQVAHDLRVLGRALRQPSLRALLVSWFGWAMARKASRVVLVIVGYDLGGVSAAAAVTVATLLAAALAAPWGGLLGDRWSAARALSVGYALQAAALAATAVAVASGGRAEVLLVLAAGVGASSALTRPVHLGALPAVARHPDELTMGNAASASLDGLASMLGPLVAGLVLVLAGPAGRSAFSPWFSSCRRSCPAASSSFGMTARLVAVASDPSSRRGSGPWHVIPTPPRAWRW
jgi:MFS family permease